MVKTKAVATVTAKVTAVSTTTSATVAAVAVTTQQRDNCNGNGWRNGVATVMMATEMAMATTATAMAGMRAATVTPTEGAAATVIA